MKRKLYDLFVPKAIRNNIYRANARQVEESELARVRAVETALPPAELSAAYIARLQVLTDCHALLHALPKHAIVGELGVHCGEFSDKICTITCPQRLHLFGAWSTTVAARESGERQRQVVEMKFRAEIAAGQITLQPAALLAELANFGPGYFDWIYNDACYSLADMTSLLDICHQKVKPNGIIAGGNYTAGSVLYRTRYGVIEAVNTFCKKNGWEMIYLTNECHRKLSYAIRKMVL